jgi:hypothetical protein
MKAVNDYITNGNKYIGILIKETQAYDSEIVMLF